MMYYSVVVVEKYTNQAFLFGTHLVSHMLIIGYQFSVYQFMELTCSFFNLQYHCTCDQCWTIYQFFLISIESHVATSTYIDLITRF